MATIQNRLKMRHLAEKADNLAALYTLGTFKSTPLNWHRSRSVVKDTNSVFLVSVLSFFLFKLTQVTAVNRIQFLLANCCFRKPAWLGQHLPIVQDGLNKLKEAGPEKILL